MLQQHFETIAVVWGNETVDTCASLTALWVEQNQNVYFNIYFWFRVLFVYLGPCTALVVLNALLFKALRAAQIRRMQLFKDNQTKSECSRQRDSNCTTLMLIVVVTVFLIVELPLAVLTMINIFDNIFEWCLSDEVWSILNVVIVFTNFFISLSYPINFAIYCGMSRQFRETFQDLFARGAAATVGHAVRTNESCRYSTVNGLKNNTHETGV